MIKKKFPFFEKLTKMIKYLKLVFTYRYAS